MFDGHSTADQVVSAFAGRVKGRTFVLTGPAPDGLGAATLYALARAKPHALVLVGRNAEKLHPVVQRIQEIDSAIVVVMLDVDLGSFASVRAGAASLLAEPRVPQVDVLINNAAIIGPKALTVDGVETHFQVNHLSHFLLTALLLPKLLKSSEPRIVNVSARAHARGVAEWNSWNEQPGDNFDPWIDGYTQTKLANVLFTTGLVSRFGPRGLKAVSVHPGSILTGLSKDYSREQIEARLEKAKNSGGDSFLKTVEEGAATSLVAALDPDIPNGAFLIDCNVAKQSELSASEDKANELWNLSERIVCQTFV